MKRVFSKSRVGGFFGFSRSQSNSSAAPKRAALRFEALEDRRFLSATPWENELASSATLSALASTAFPSLESGLVDGERSLSPSSPKRSFSSAVDALLARAGQNPESVSESFVFNLSSAPESSYTIYLDFNGHVYDGTYWNDGQGVVSPAYDLDGDATTFSNAELRAVYEIWLRVSEDYLPFNVNVTTKEPSLDQLINSGDGDTSYGIRAVIGGSNDWYPGVGGITYVGSFTWNTDAPCYIFQSDNVRWQGEATSHEVGHSLGLSHDGTGFDGWSPIMGGGYNWGLSVFSKEEYDGGTNLEDDLAIITTRNGFDYRDDDYGDSFDDAAELKFQAVGELGTGLIERSSDVDFFSFNLNGEESIITIGGIDQITNLDALVKIYDSNRNLIGTYDPIETLFVSIDVSDFAPGKYYLSVEGTGLIVYGKTIYTDYGILGAYSITTERASVVPDPYEPNEGLVYAYRTGVLSDSKTFDSEISLVGDVDAYSFTMASTGTSDDYVRLNSLDYRWNVTCLAVGLYDSNKTRVGFAWAQSVGTISLEGLAPDTYYIEIYDYFENPGASRYQLEIAVQDSILPTPSLSVSGSGTSADVAFSRVQGATSYLFEYSTDKYFRAKSSLTRASADSFSIDNLTPDVDYYFRVRAVAEGSNLADSDFATFGPYRLEANSFDLVALDGAALSATRIVLGERLSVRDVGVANVGSASSPPFVVSFYASSDAICDPSDSLMGTARLPSLPPNASVRLNFDDLDASNLSSGAIYNVLILVSVAAETDVSNNVAATVSTLSLFGEAPNMASVPFERDSYSAWAGNDLRLAISDEFSVPRNAAFFWDYGDGFFVEGERAGWTRIQSREFGARTIRARVVDLDANRVVAKGEVALTVESAPIAVDVRSESLLDGSAIRLELSARSSVGALPIRRWVIEWSDGATETIEALGDALTVSRFFSSGVPVSGALASITLVDANDQSTTYSFSRGLSAAFSASRQIRDESAFDASRTETGIATSLSIPTSDLRESLARATRRVSRELDMLFDDDELGNFWDVLAESFEK